MRRCLALSVVAQADAYSGRTAPGRLAWVDRYLLLRELSLFADDEPSTTRVFADIGIGDDATTTLELAEALQQDADAPLIVACEADANRCAAAHRFASASHATTSGASASCCSASASSNVVVASSPIPMSAKTLVVEGSSSAKRLSSLSSK